VVKELMPTIVGCLESQNCGVIRAALPTAQEVLLLCNGKLFFYGKCLLIGCMAIYGLMVVIIVCELP